MPAAALLGLWMLSPWAYFALSCLLCWQTLASHELRAESKKVSRLLEEGDLEAARAQVADALALQLFAALQHALQRPRDAVSLAWVRLEMASGAR